MEKYKAKSIIIGRKKRKDSSREDYPCFIAIFDINDPQKGGNVPKKIIDYEDIHKVMISGCDINYLLAGNDLVVNDLESFEVETKGKHIIIKGKHIKAKQKK
ncbi:hypothetical protein JXB31_00300 [Candidatus Woesearchaeota archaeon]|nr:hypothetical protein [Candidatus Woesearchaeota archaeon]